MMSDIREQIIKALKKYGDHPVGAPTWWFKFDTDYKTPQIRRELLRMMHEGIVFKTDRSRRGQMQWRLTEPHRKSRGEGDE